MFYDKFKKLCESHCTTPNAVCKKLGYSNATAPYWKKTGSTPKYDTIQKIASFFDVPVSELLGEPEQTGKEIYEQIKNAAAGDDARSRVIDLVSQLSPEQSYLALAYLQGLLAQPPQPVSPQAAPKEQ